MRRAQVLFCCCLLLPVVLALAPPALAQEPAEEHPPGHEHGHEMPAGQPEMSPELQAMMAAWEKAMTPGAPHAALAESAGEWEFSGRFWMEPGAPPMESSGTASRSMLFGGRVLEEKVSSTFMGQAWEGLGLTGYDNVSGEYWSVWTDSMSTGVMLATGTCAEGGSCTFAGSYNDPMTGQPKPVRMTMEQAEGREIFRMYEAGPDGTDRMSMELVYTRR
jgi:hypothetical protein